MHLDPEPVDELKNKPRSASARKMARKLVKECGNKNAPVLLNDVLSRLRQDHELSVHSWDFGDNVSGVLIMEKDCSTIGYNEKQHVHRNRFTVAHEIGHLLFNHACTDSSVGFQDSHAYETEANQFAAELLMPLEWLKKDLLSGIKDVKTLAERYWVSEEALGWRIADPQTRLLKYL